MPAAVAPAGAQAFPVDPNLPVPEEHLDLKTFINHVKIEKNAEEWHKYIQDAVQYKNQLKAFAQETLEKNHKWTKYAAEVERNTAT